MHAKETLKSLIPIQIDPNSNRVIYSFSLFGMRNNKPIVNSTQLLRQHSIVKKTIRNQNKYHQFGLTYQKDRILETELERRKICGLSFTISSGIFVQKMVHSSAEESILDYLRTNDRPNVEVLIGLALL